MYVAEIDYGGCYGQQYSDTVQAAIQSVVEQRVQDCPSAAQLASTLSWTATGDYWAPLASSGVVVGQVWDDEGNPLPVGTFDYTIQPGGGGDSAYPGFTAPEIAMVFSWGFGAVVFFWFLGQCIGAALGVIRRA